MNGPGVSIFQGNDSIKLNNSNQKEEEEFLEDERIRNAELRSLINKAFSDLDEDDDSSISSSHCSLPCETGYNSTQNSISGKENQYSRESSLSSNFPGTHKTQLENNYVDHSELIHQIPYRGNSYEVPSNDRYSSHNDHCCQTNSFGHNAPPSQLDVYKQSELNGMTQLKVLYDVRLREIEKLKNDLEAERDEKEHILRKLNVSEHDKKKLEINLSSCQSLLSESKKHILELEKEIVDLKENVKIVEKSKIDLGNELEIVKEQLLHQEQKYIALERSDINVKREKQMDLVIDSINAKHNTEINFLQQQLDAAIDKINRKEDDYKNLEKKLEEMEKKHAANLLNKCDATIRQEATVKALLDEANKEKLELTRKISSLQQECNMLKNDLEQCQMFPKLKYHGNSSSEEKDSDSFILLSSSWKTESKKKSMDLIQTDVVTKLKDELHRALIGQRAKRLEITKLQEQITQKDSIIRKMKEDEEYHLKQTESLKKDMNNIMDQAAKSRNLKQEAEQTQLISSLQSEIEKTIKENISKTEKITELEKEIEKLKENLKGIEVSNKTKNHDYLKYYETEVDRLKNENELLLKNKELEWGREMEKLLTECDEIKQLYMEMKANKDKVVESSKELKCKFEEILKEKQELQDQLLKKEEDVKQLQDHIMRLVEEKKMVEERLKSDFQKEYRTMYEKQNDEIKELKLKINNATTSEEELKNFKNEIFKSRQRYLELEATLKRKFEEEMLKLNDENVTLRDDLKKKEAELTIRKMCMTQKKDIGTTTDEFMVIETIYEQNLVEIKKLEDEIYRLRVLEEEKNNEILELKASYERRLDEQLLELEKNMESKYQKEIALTEHRVKELSLKYLSEEIEKLQAEHVKDIQCVKNEEIKKVLHLKTVITEKEAEINDLLLKVDEFKKLIITYEEEKNQAARMMMQWAKEVESLKYDKEQILKESQNLKACNQEIINVFEETKTKLKNTRKAALVYKRRLNEIKTGLSEKYRNLLMDIQQKVDDAVAEKEQEIEIKLNEIEKEYKNKEKLLRLEYDRNLVS
ncbi:centrosomal protein of 152 kDa isoform X1 [Halyomorpha halys]|uniref:centrosomal protein of 152 kDa isoform X1 n=1 Tax=Halyomorpha halys TaxID=286706 RepID=UPI0006D4E11B|nr:myosin-2 heavy chain isoform X1 [Halyomorpha halys]